MYQKIYPNRAIGVDSVKINTSLIMVRECLVEDVGGVEAGGGEDDSDDDMWASAAAGGGALAPVAGAASTNVGHPNSGSPELHPPSPSTGGYVVSALKRRVLPACPG